MVCILCGYSLYQYYYIVTRFRVIIELVYVYIFFNKSYKIVYFLLKICLWTELAYNLLNSCCYGVEFRMLAYLQGFTPFEICQQFWFPFSDPKTVCRLYISLENKGEKKIEIPRYSESSLAHAEVVAYKKISRKLFAQLDENKQYLNSESKLDFGIATNNSSCKGCRKNITNWIKNLKKSINGTHLQLTLFFSHLYVGEEGSVDKVVISFTNWIVDLVKTCAIAVDICPIIVCKMLPKQDYKYKLEHLSDVVKRDTTCLDNFRKLFVQLTNATDGTFAVQSDLFCSDEQVKRAYLHIFTWEKPQGISVRPIGKYSSPASLPEPSQHFNPKFQIKSNTVETKQKKHKSSGYYSKMVGGKRKVFRWNNHSGYKRRPPIRKSPTTSWKSNSIK